MIYTLSFLQINPVAVLLMIFAGLTIVSIIKWFSKRSHVIREIKKADEKVIADFKDGDYGRITGKVAALGESITAPFSERKCVYYHVLIEEWSNNTGHEHYQTVIEEEVMADIILTDGKDYAFVQTDEPETTLYVDVEELVNGNDELPLSVRRFMKKHNVMRDDCRFREGVLEDGEEFAVSGYGHWVDADTLQVKFPVKRVLLLRSGKEKTVYITDEPEVIDASSKSNEP